MLTIQGKRCKEIMKFDYICYHLVLIRNLSGNFPSDRANCLYNRVAGGAPARSYVGRVLYETKI